MTNPKLCLSQQDIEIQRNSDKILNSVPSLKEMRDSRGIDRNPFLFACVLKIGLETLSHCDRWIHRNTQLDQGRPLLLPFDVQEEAQLVRVRVPL